MNISSIIGVVLLAIGVFFGMILKGADPVAMFTNVPALLIVIVGTMGAVMMSNDMPANMAALKAMKKCFFPGPPLRLDVTVEQITKLADRARREGLLALEEECQNIDDPFFKKAVQLAVDGTDSDALHKALVADVKAMRDRHKSVAAWYTQMGVFAPTFGIIGAVVGLIAVLAKLDDPSQLGHGIGAAFVATFWGVFMANGMFLPWANTLKAQSAAEIAQRNLIIEGVLAVQTGTSPREVAQVLSGYLQPSMRKAA